jgi:hypothetical protein
MQGFLIIVLKNMLFSDCCIFLTRLEEREMKEVENDNSEGRK